MSEYRTPAEQQAHAEQKQRIQAVLDRAVSEGASCMLAIHLGEPADVVERWTDAIWNRLRAELQDGRPSEHGVHVDDRLAAIIMLLEPRMVAEMQAVLGSLEEAP